MSSTATNSLLARELAKLPAVGNGTLGQSDEAMSATLGARLLANFQPHERFQMRVSVAGNVALVLLRVKSYLASQGRLAAEDQTGASPVPHISGVLRCGLIHKVSVLVHVEVLSHEPDFSVLSITAAANEGLFHQHAAQIAVQRMVQQVRSACGARYVTC